MSIVVRSSNVSGVKKISDERWLGSTEISDERWLESGVIREVVPEKKRGVAVFQRAKSTTTPI